jgi:DNA uptake protein ComE-like DNA-binding protein
MHKRYTHLILCLIVLTTTRILIQGLYVVSPSSYTWPVFEILSMARTLEQDDPESTLSRGEKICFWTASQSDLVLVPGIGEKIAARLIEEQTHLSILVKTKPDLSPTFLKEVKGIGAKTSKKLMTYLDFRNPPHCKPTTPNTASLSG